ncbi:hypothetical protein AB0L75_11585 [Streptomyces sp. NPDC052101]|uniref:hypothetical protein n=1 Tax=Streptomyces sp. NPDC052101 TaxID=3155763 RepID=UPI00343DAD4B
MEDLLDLTKVKAIAVSTAVGAAIGGLWLMHPAVGACAAVAAVAGHFAIKTLLQQRHGRPDPFDGPAELTHRARLEVDDLAHCDPCYQEAAGYLELAEEALSRAATPLLPAA